MKKLFLLIVCVLLLMLAFCQIDSVPRFGVTSVSGTLGPITIDPPGSITYNMDSSITAWFGQIKYDTSLFEVKNDSLVYKIKTKSDPIGLEKYWWVWVIGIVIGVFAIAVLVTKADPIIPAISGALRDFIHDKKLFLLLAFPIHLTWSDFKGKQTDFTANAQVDCGSQLITTITDGRVFFKVETFFNPETSFAVKRTRYILEHENGHLLIAEVYTRRIIKALKNLQGKNEDVVFSVNTIFDSYCRMRDLTQKYYDDETGHGENWANLERWNKWIKEQLKLK